ncbi:lambda exonuclease family protein [Bradyrhizobium sp. Ai1a-2]|uniref:lambda exonuclease family protein n=1 Tax=Bradyrhizobium sp. Ai1a-2 TaxID=196490 RepID=UPI001FCC67D5|nr:lambda exonuclease family protein [Bradyrhizobium sp. Ai1a-2]
MTSLETNIHMVEQGSAEWKALRCGKVTASRIPDVFAKIKSGGWGASRANYKAELILERLTGKPYEGYHSKDMETGQLLEPAARAEYELRNRCDVQQIGFVDHPTIPNAGASADGLVGADGFSEFKCPKPATHLEYITGGVLPSTYEPQIMWNFACNQRRVWCDFCSFNPDFPPQMQLFVFRVLRDESRIRVLEQGVREFLREVDIETETLRRKYFGKAA